MNASDTIKIEVSIRMTRRVGYETLDVAVAKVEDNAAWPVTAALEGILDDVTERIARQVKAESKRLAALREEAEDML